MDNLLAQQNQVRSIYQLIHQLPLSEHPQEYLRALIYRAMSELIRHHRFLMQFLQDIHVSGALGYVFGNKQRLTSLSFQSKRVFPQVS